MARKKKSNTVRVKPADGLDVKHPSTGLIINGEIDIESSKDVKRLIRFGDLIQVETKTTKTNKEK
jgi:hypothetical protein